MTHKCLGLSPDVVGFFFDACAAQDKSSVDQCAGSLTENRRLEWKDKVVSVTRLQS